MVANSYHIQHFVTTRLPVGRRRSGTAGTSCGGGLGAEACIHPPAGGHSRAVGRVKEALSARKEGITNRGCPNVPGNDGILDGQKQTQHGGIGPAPLRAAVGGGARMSGELAVGVVGVGTMGAHHARVYDELSGADLIGVADADPATARSVAEEYDTHALGKEQLLERADAVSVAVPTEFHAEVATEAIASDTATLVEKPFVTDPDRGRAVAARARRRGVPLQVGHVERFNPAVEALQDILPEVEPIAVAARRQGPPVDRTSSDSAAMDLMIHDIDILLTVADSPLRSVSAVSAHDGQHISAHLSFESGLVGTLTASRVTQEKIRDLAITAEDCQVEIDYLDRSVEIHRHSMPEFLVDGGDVRYRHESIIERPTIENGEPLKAELAAFVEAVRSRTEPAVTAEDGIRAAETALRVETAAERAEQLPAARPP